MAQNQWEAIGPVPFEKSGVPYQGILVSCEHPQSDTNYQRFYVGSNSSGLFYTEDGGVFWRNLTDSAKLPGLGIQDIAITEADPGLIVLATGMTTYGKDYGQGIIYTRNHGLSWQVVKAINSKSHTRKIARRLMFLKGSYSLIASVEDELWFCEDIREEGSWKRVWKAFPNDERAGDYYVSEMKFHPNFPSDPIVYFSCDDPGNDQGGSKAYRLNIQNNFSVKELELPTQKASARIDIACSEAAPDRLYCILNRPGSNFELLISDSLGESWFVQRQLNAYGMGMAGFEMEVSPTDPEVIYYGGISFFKQVGILKGQANRVQRNIHDDTRDMMILKGSEPGNHGLNDIILNANDGGLAINFSGAKENWKSLVGEGIYGLNIAQFYGIALDPSDTNMIAGGLQDNGTMLWDRRSTPKRVYGGDGGDCVFTQDGKLLANFNSGARPGQIVGFKDRKPISYPKSSFGVSDSPLEINPSNPSKLLYAHAQVGNPPIFDLVEMDINSGEVRNLSNKGNKAVRAIGVAASDPQTIYYANLHVTYSDDLNGVVYRTNDGGESWVDITGGLLGSKSMRVADIELHPDDAEKVLVAYSSPSPHHKVFYSSNGGNSWQDVSTGLSEFGVNRLKISKHGIAMAACDDGLFVFDENARSWRRFSESLPIVPVSDIEIDYCREKILISTFGRGIYERDYPWSDRSSKLPALEFNRDTIITTDVFIARDVVVGKKVRVELRGEPNAPINVELIGNAEILLNKGSELILQNANISTPCSKGWKLNYNFGLWSKKVKAKWRIEEAGELIKLDSSNFEQ